MEIKNRIKITNRSVRKILLWLSPICFIISLISPIVSIEYYKLTNEGFIQTKKEYTFENFLYAYLEYPAIINEYQPLFENSDYLIFRLLFCSLVFSMVAVILNEFSKPNILFSLGAVLLSIIPIIEVYRLYMKSPYNNDLVFLRRLYVKLEYGYYILIIGVICSILAIVLDLIKDDKCSNDLYPVI